MTGLVIYALGVGDGILALTGLPGAKGSYRDDLGHIHDWQPALVISMTTAEEMQASGARNLGAELQAMGCRWVHLPVPDFTSPPEPVIAQWPAVSRAALQALAGGGRVLAHCRGGCGRSGMVALRLMIEAGEGPEAALERLRALRPCAVETDAQMAWAMSAPRQPAVFQRHSD